MEISQEQNNGCNIVSIQGRLDASTAPKLEEVLGAFGSESDVKVVVNCTTLDYISSAGLRVLLATAKEYKKNSGKIALAGLNPNVKQVFEISGFTSIFPIYESKEDALKEM